MPRRSPLTLPIALLAVACSSSDESSPPADVTGEYQLSLRAGANECGLQNWSEGSTTSGIPMTVTENGTRAQGDVAGLTRIYLDLVLGGHVYSGDVSGNRIAMQIEGTRALSKGNCAYTLVSAIDGTLSTDTLSGTITLYNKTNGGSDCGALSTCKNTWAFNGVRPPRN